MQCETILGERGELSVPREGTDATGSRDNHPRRSLPQSLVSNHSVRTSLVVQWLRIHLPTQGTQVRSLVREDPTCRGATKSMCHNY